MKLISKTTSGCRRVTFRLAEFLTTANWQLAFVLAVSAITATVHAGEPLPLRTGPVTMVFDADNVFLRYVRVGSHEVLRGINAPIRNENRETIAPEVSNAVKLPPYGIAQIDRVVD